MAQSWHSGDKLQRDLLEFHQACASFPRVPVAEAQRHHVSTMSTFRNTFQRNGVATEFHFTGSTYEGLKVPSTDMEFDVMVVLNGERTMRVENLRPLYYNLYCGSNINPFSKTKAPGSNHLDPDKVVSYFHGELKRVLNQYPEVDRIIKLRRHGPAVQMDVYKNPDGRTLFYSVDMVPAYQVGDGGFYVAKPFKDEQLDGDQQSSLAWRKSFSLEEKSRLDTIDQGNKCRKQCIRILKVLRDSEPGLHHLNSYCIKTAILNLSREQSHLDWGQKNLGQRLMDVLKYLCKALEQGSLKHHYVPGFNILSGLGAIHRENMKYRVQELLRSEQSFSSALRNARG